MTMLPNSSASPRPHAGDDARPRFEPADLRVVFLLDALQNRNGVGTYYMDLLAHLKDRIAEAHLFCPNADERQFHEWVSMPLPGDRTQKLIFPRVPSLWRRVKAIQPHVVVLATPGPYGFLGYGYARRHRLPLCVAYQTDYEELVKLYWTPMLSRPSAGAVRWAQWRFFRAGSVVVTLSEQMAARARESGVHDTRLIGTPIGREFLTRPTAPLGEQVRRCLFLGRLAPEKNVEQFVDAAAALPEVEFLIAGDGPLRDRIVAQAEAHPNIRYLGWLCRDEVVKTLDSVDMLVLPSSIEAFGTVAIEAMARGRLVLTSAECGVSQWPELAEGLNVVQPGEAVAGAIARVCALPHADRLRIATAARGAAHRINGLTVDTWLGVLWELANTNRRWNHPED
jgi:glycosyltransferase involved in cell wall biosynthesis